MSAPNWVVVAEISGTAQAEILRGWLEALGIPCLISQESVGQYSYPVTVGRIGRVQILVSQADETQARQVLQEYWDRAFDAGPEEPDEPD